MKTQVCYAMDVGPRANQQDCILADGKVVQESDAFYTGDAEGDCLVFAVADGLGGHSQGEAASRFVCERMALWKEGMPEDESAIEKAVIKIQNAAEQGGLDEDSGSTLAGLMLKGRAAFAFNAGDSRVYRITQKGMTRLTHDHSFVQRLVDGKLLTPREAFENPFRNLVDFGLGLLFADRWAGVYRMFTSQSRLAPGDVFLLCTDGVSDVLTEDEMRAVLGDAPLENIEKLTSALREKGLRDNMSLILVRVDGGQEKTR